MIWCAGLFSACWQSCLTPPLTSHRIVPEKLQPFVPRTWSTRHPSKTTPVRKIEIDVKWRGVQIQNSKGDRELVVGREVKGGEGEKREVERCRERTEPARCELSV